MPYHVGKTKFERLVERALAELPPQFAQFLEEVPIQVRTRPTPKQLRELGLEDDELVFGYYVGPSLAERSVLDSGHLGGVIFIFQEDHELVTKSEQELIREVRTTVLHEIGHHFGMSEEDLDKLGYA